MLLATLLVVLLSPQQPPTCQDVEVCRAEALIAHAKKDFEAFHDLAWAAYNKGRKTDTALMLLVARAQGLSGRPGDALVMLERIAALGGATDAVTSEDFARVRALARWPEVEAKLAAASARSGGPARVETKTEESRKPAIVKAEPKKEVSETAVPKKEETKKAEPKRVEAKANEAKKDEAEREEGKKVEPGKPGTVNPDRPRVSRAPGEPLRFTTLLTPSALAYDAVSKRFIIADRAARRVAVIDETTGQVSTLVGAAGALGDVGGIAIDARRGDLWVVSAGDNGPTLHKMQLISGRVLRTVPVNGIDERIVGVTFVQESGIVAADAGGNLWRVASSGKSEKIGALEYVPTAIASDALGRVYVSAGGPRLARYSVASGLRRLGVVELPDGMPTDTPFVVGADRLHAVVRGDGEYEIRSMRIK